MEIEYKKIQFYNLTNEKNRAMEFNEVGAITQNYIFNLPSKTLIKIERSHEPTSYV